MSIFDAYLDDLVFLATDIRTNMTALSSGENVDQLSKTISSVFDQADELIKQAEIEARSFESKERKLLNDKLKIHKETFVGLKSEYETQLYKTQKSQLFGKSGEDRGRMLETNEKLRRQNEIIENCMRTVAETEEIGVETILELKNNREKIDSARTKGQEFSAVADDADKRLKSMWFRHKTW
eukprot:CAMPEP_0170402150 /NCGR_PEP_ID=MMETSP0117_2-20130122/25405_1 /TAXON_ID=400756 /ORGANISM="Durinskia baltica, Strain CSIRO CS-38" /LENGTH=181 /DNA_ID=CAMNT_0010659001 /DNA_START=30 /DNA_END=572 /DNA_ORIENTATION=-